MTYIDEVFSNGGMLSKNLTGYSERAGQIELAEAVGKALIAQTHLLVEAPTGVGKSIGYLVPAIYHWKTSNERLIVVTAGIALQEQLINKDLPFLQKTLPFEFDFALAKGRTNYLCLERYDHLQDILREAKDRKDVDEINKIASWAMQTKIGDVSELSFQPSSKVWGEFSVGSDHCIGKKCKHYEACFVQQAKARINSVAVVVTNYHLFFADVAVRMETDGNVAILPTSSIVIGDEFHKAPEIARSYFGFEFSEYTIKRLVKDTLKVFKESGSGAVVNVSLLDRLEKESSRTFAQALFLRKSKDYKSRLKYEDQFDSSELVKVLGDYVTSMTTESQSIKHDGSSREKIRKLVVRCEKLINGLKAASSASDTNMVFFIEIEGIGRKEYAKIGAKQIDVAPTLRAEVFERVRSVIGTSATMSVAGNFEDLAYEVGCDEFEELIVDSPFDMKKQALLVVPKDICEPNEEMFGKEVAAHVVEIIKQAQGRTLALFTSFKNLELAHAKCIEEGLPYRILKQGDLPKIQLIEEFKKDVSSVLLGTSSFWEGVDVPGDACSCVVIDRLPFVTPDDPIMDAISSRDRNWFAKWSLPKAVIAFRQGFGRLIRRTTDRGVVVVLDRRIVDKSYGKKFVAGLGAPTSRRLEEIGTFLRNTTMADLIGIDRDPIPLSIQPIHWTRI